MRVIDPRLRNLVSSSPRKDLSESAFAQLPLSAVIFSVLSILISIIVPNVRHSSLVAITVCGILIGAELLRIIHLKGDILTPRAIIAAFGVYFFYVVPLLHLVLDTWPLYIPPPADWRDAITKLALLHFIGLFTYLVSVSLSTPQKSLRKLNERAFVQLALLVALLGAISWLYVAVSFGGPSAYLNSLVSGTAELTGYGSILLLAESWPSLILVILLVVNRDKLNSQPVYLVLLFVAFVALQFLVGGLRGSRALTVWPFMIGLIVCHLVVRRITLRALLLIVALMLPFAWIYSIYKNAGVGIFDLFNGAKTTGELVDETGRDVNLLLTEDFGRSGVQSLALDHVVLGADLAMGETYLGDILKFIPGSRIPFEVRDKTAVATELFYGYPSEVLGGFESSRILGLSGEAMVNFGLVGPIIAMAVFGRIVARFDRHFSEAKGNGDALASALIAAVYPSAVILILISDLDNVILFSLKYALPIAGIAWLSSRGVGSFFVVGKK